MATGNKEQCGVSLLLPTSTLPQPDSISWSDLEQQNIWEVCFDVASAVSWEV